MLGTQTSGYHPYAFCSANPPRKVDFYMVSEVTTSLDSSLWIFQSKIKQMKKVFLEMASIH